MIIRNDRKKSLLLKRLAMIFGVIAVLGLSLLVAYRQYRNSWRGNAIMSCDMETVVEEGGVKYFMAGNTKLNNGHTQVLGNARNGKYACVVYGAQEFGATFEFWDVHPGEVLEVSVWRKNADHKGRLIADASWGVYLDGVLSGGEDRNGWEELVLRIEAPTFVENGSVKFYVWNPTPDPVYFDDFAVRRIKPGYDKKVGGYTKEDSVPSINLLISDKGMQKLQNIRTEALQKGILASGADEWVKMKFFEGKKEYTGSLRLKGDWTDHLVGDKWSFRISLDPGMAWRRMVTFSVQNPRTRDFLSEWVFHQMLDKEDILSPRYGFIELKINGVSRGLYAYEEHFDKQIVEYNSRREGPIMKFDEEGLWEVQENIIEQGGFPLETHIPFYQASSIAPFGIKAAIKDSAMFRQVEIARQLVYQYKTGQKTIWDLFDAKKVARYYAIVDLLNAQHGFIWHNQRWYYNPVISRMEPIGFDGYTESGPLIWIDRPFIGFARNVRYMAPGYREHMFEHFFHDPKFLELYIGSLLKFTDPAYLDAFYFEHKADLEKYERWIKHEWPQYAYKVKAMFDHGKLLRNLIMPLKYSSVKAHLEGKKEGKGYHYRVYNFHCLPVVLIGVGAKSGKMDAMLDKPTLVDAYNREFPAEYFDAYSPAEGKFIFFRVPGIDSTFETEILPWSEPSGMTPEQNLFENLKITSNEYYEVNDSSKRVTFKTGKYKTSKDILIPKGYQVWFQKGVEIDFVGGAKFISKSQVLMFGDEDQPILIHSSDKSANGFTVLQAEGKSEFNYVVFDNLNTLHENGWNLTGAVTLYESEIGIDHCRFVNNHCEDALNTVRCVFTFSNSYIGYTFGDGFDADFCHGTLINGTFSHTGNDAIDFSGSFIDIQSVNIEYAGDKGISLGEECTATIERATIRNSPIGIAAKDLTVVTINYIELFDNEQAFTAYQKKPEYGPGTLVVNKYKAEGNKQLYVLQAGSKLTIDGELIEGKR